MAETAERKKVKWSYVCAAFMLAVIAAVQLSFAAHLEYYPRYDVEAVYNSAKELADSNTLSGDNLIYMARYGNNFGLAFVMGHVIRITRFFGINDFYAFVLVNTLLINAGIFFLWASIRRISGAAFAFIMLALTMLYIPLYLFPVMIYTDTASMAFPMICVYLFIRIRSPLTNVREKVIAAVLAGLCAGLGASIKTTVAVIILAMAVSLIFLRVKGLWVMVLISATASLVVIFSFKAAYNGMIPKEVSDRYRFPFTHWIMVGLSDGGRINADDWEATENLPTYKEKDEDAKSKIVQRISEKGISGMIAHSAGKLAAIYSETDLQPGGIIPFVSIDTDLARFLEHVRWNSSLYKIYNTVFLYGAIALALLSVFSKNRDILALIAFAGLNAFFIIWEVNPKYATNFLLVIIYMASIGAKKILDNRVIGGIIGVVKPLTGSE